MWDLETLKKKASNTVERDIKSYQEAIDGLAEWEKKECMCPDALHHWCAKCSWIHSHKTTIQRVQDKYWHG
jgi:hypothetical protein